MRTYEERIELFSSFLKPHLKEREILMRYINGVLKTNFSRKPLRQSITAITPEVCSTIPTMSLKLS